MRLILYHVTDKAPPPVNDPIRGRKTAENRLFVRGKKRTHRGLIHESRLRAHQEKTMTSKLID